MMNTSKFLSFLALGAACAALLAPLPASAQWGWKDSKGNRVFSDKPPPTEVPDKDVFKRPAAVSTAPVVTPIANSTATPAAGAAATPAATDNAPKLAGKDAELEKKKKETEAAEAAKRKQQEEETAKARTDNCARAKQAQATLQSGTRIATTNTKGEREVMDDNARAAETKRLQDIINKDCTKQPG
jgi:hypothetical protein